MGDIEIVNLLVKLGAEMNLLDLREGLLRDLLRIKNTLSLLIRWRDWEGRGLRAYELVNDNQCERIEINSIEKINDKLFMDLEEADKRFKKIYKQ